MKIVERRQKKVETQDPQSKLKSGRSVTKGLVNLILVAKAHTLSCEQCTNGVGLLVCWPVSLSVIISKMGGFTFPRSIVDISRVADPDPDRIRFSNFSGSGSGSGFSPDSGTIK